MAVGNLRRLPKRAARRRPALVHQFLIVLAETNPLVWRRIQVPERCTFWDLHVAIQDAMGWLDCHLHEFTVADMVSGGVVRIGIPGDEFEGQEPCLPGWEVLVSALFEIHRSPATYVYDFGDDWEHAIVHEGLVSAETGIRYPRCTAGARACPPEDCGGTSGYERLLEALRNPQDPEHEEMVQWSGGSFDPDRFEPAAIRFDDPERRWKRVFQGARDPSSRN